MRKRKVKAVVLFGCSVLMAAGIFFLAIQPAFATKPECEDYCYNWYFQCRQQGGSLEYCTNWMMWCLEEYCGW